MKNNKTIERYLDAIERTFGEEGAGGVWPANAAQLQASFSDTVSLDFYHIILKPLFKKYTPEQIAKRIPAFSIIFPLRHAGIIGLKVAKKYQPERITQEEILDCFFRLVSLLEKKIYSEDPFFLDGKYLILPKRKIKEICQKTNWQVPTQKDRERIAHFAVTLESYAWALFYDCYRSTGFEIHGPYDVSDFFGKGFILLIKDGHNLSPVEIWERDYPYKTITLYLVYQDAKISLNFINRQFSPEPIKNKLKYFAFFVDGKAGKPKEIEKINKKLEEMMIKQTAKVNALSPLEIIKKGAEIYYYSLKPFYELAKKDWRPTKKVYKQIEKLGMRLWERGSKRKGKVSGKFYRRLFDPRNDFYGE